MSTSNDDGYVPPCQWCGEPKMRLDGEWVCNNPDRSPRPAPAATGHTVAADNGELVEALRFYANNDNYCQLTFPGVPYSDPSTFAPVLQDGGKLAIAALSRLTTPPVERDASITDSFGVTAELRKASGVVRVFDQRGNDFATGPTGLMHYLYSSAEDKPYEPVRTPAPSTAKEGQT